MAEMNQEHIDILCSVTGNGNTVKYMDDITCNEALAAMRRLQIQIDQLKKENEILRDIVPSEKICQCDDPTIGHDPGFCKRCNKTRI